MPRTQSSVQILWLALQALQPRRLEQEKSRISDNLFWSLPMCKIGEKRKGMLVVDLGLQQRLWSEILFANYSACPIWGRCNHDRWQVEGQCCTWLRSTVWHSCSNCISTFLQFYSEAPTAWIQKSKSSLRCWSITLNIFQERLWDMMRKVAVKPLAELHVHFLNKSGVARLLPTVLYLQSVNK